MDLGTIKVALGLWGNGEPFAWVSTLETSGSSPRHSGAAMVVRADGSSVGTVGGGALEGRAIRTALETLDARASCLMDYQLNDGDSTGLGMICGGRGRLLIEYVDAASRATADLYAAALDLLAAGGRGWLVTGVSGCLGSDDGGSADVSGRAAAADAGLTIKRALVDATGTVTGDAPVPLEVLRALPQTGGALDGHTADDRPSIYVQPIGVSGSAYVFGAGHCGMSLIPLLRMVGFRTIIVDDRPDFANPDRFPDADSVVVPASFDEALAGLPIDEQSYLVIMTRGHLFDRSVLAQALRTPAAYIGMIGSKKKIAGIYAALREQGFGDEDLARVHAPIGVKIGAETPAEIAVSIAAEIIGLRRRE